MAKKNEIKHFTLNLTKTQLDSLKKMLEYLEDAESTHFEEHLEDGGDKTDHIYFHTQRVRRMIKKQIK